MFGNALFLSQEEEFRVNIMFKFFYCGHVNFCSRIFFLNFSKIFFL